MRPNLPPVDSARPLESPLPTSGVHTRSHRNPAQRRRFDCAGWTLAWASVLSLERLCVSDLCQIRLTIVSDSRRVRQLRFAQPPYIDTL